jgi:hypothetical protein
MRRTATIVGLLIIVAGVAYFAMFQRDFISGIFGTVGRGISGATPAKTPDEALDKFKKFCKKRDYETAALYCGGVYGEQMKLGAKAAHDLGSARDDLLSLAEKRNITDLTAKTKVLIVKLDGIIYFPHEFDVVDMKSGDDRATAKLRSKGVDFLVEVKREGEQWKIHVPLPNEPGLRASVEYLRNSSQKYANALNKVRGWIVDKTIQTRDDLEEKLEAELRQAGEVN